jgi:hypothetical protein
MLIVNARCKRCGGNLYIERNIDGDTLKCLACGFERDIPAEVNPVPVVSQDEWKLPANSEEIKQEVIKDMQKVVLVSDEELEKQKDAIIADYLNPNITLAQMLVKWHIQTTRWHDLKIKWNIPSKGQRGKTKVLKPVAKPVGNMPDSTKTDTKKENIMPKYTCPYCEVGWSQADALIQHMTVCHFEVAKPETKPEPQEELLRFTCVMRASTASKLITLGIKYLGDIGAFPDSKIELLKQVPHV